jgi:hypothetical protein
MDDSKDEADADESGDADHGADTSECAEKGERSEEDDGEEECDEDEDDAWNGGGGGGGGDASADNANADEEDKQEGAMPSNCGAGRASVFPSRLGFGGFGGGAVAGGRFDRGGVRKVAEYGDGDGDGDGDANKSVSAEYGMRGSSGGSNERGCRAEDDDSDVAEGGGVRGADRAECQVDERGRRPFKRP